MPISDVLLQNAFGFISALIGAVVGGYFTLKATDKAIREENAKEDRQEEKEVQNLLDAIGVEINALWSFHMRRIGEKIEALTEGQSLDIYYPLTQNYFTIYDSNASMIGRVRDPQLREAIVITYNKCKKVVDGFKYNNELLRDNRGENRVALAQMIKEDHFELKSYVEQLLLLIKTRQQYRP